ncbi:MAG: AAA family ATPase [Crenarchaeota archaeon]|nr:AAA family ATPase [Thermoproteota archaeon]
MASSSKRGVVVAVSGPPGSGKTTVAKLLAKRLNLRYVSIGQLFRELAKMKGIDILQLSRIAEKDHSIDRELDNLARLEAEKGNVVIDGHISAWIVRDLADLCVGIVAPFSVRVQRIAQRDGRPLDEVERETRAREESEAKRFREIYGIDVRDTTIFDVILNSAYFAPEQIVSIVIKALEEKLQRRSAY